MAEAKRGGSRPGNPNGKRGGSRPGSGPRVRRLQLSAAAAQELHILTLHRRGLTNDQGLAPVGVVEQLIHEKWLEYDAMIQGTVEGNEQHV